MERTDIIYLVRITKKTKHDVWVTNFYASDSELKALGKLAEASRYIAVNKERRRNPDVTYTAELEELFLHTPFGLEHIIV